MLQKTKKSVVNWYSIVINATNMSLLGNRIIIETKQCVKYNHTLSLVTKWNMRY